MKGESLAISEQERQQALRERRQAKKLRELQQKVGVPISEELNAAEKVDALRFQPWFCLALGYTYRDSK